MIKRLGSIRICTLGILLFVVSVVKAEPLNFNGTGTFNFSLTGGGIESTSDVAIFDQSASSLGNAPIMTQDMVTRFALKTTEPIQFKIVGNNGTAEMIFAGFGQKSSKMYHEFKAIDSLTGIPYYFGFQEQSTDCKVDLNVEVRADK